MRSSIEHIQVSVVYALPLRQHIVAVQVPSWASVEGAIAASGLLTRFPEISQQALRCAIFGRAVQLNAPLVAGDRIEILRPLLIDPKESRRQAAARAKQVARGR